MPIEHAMQNMRIAYEIVAWEEDHNISADDVPPAAEGLVHSSKVNIGSLNKMVEEDKKGGSVIQGMDPSRSFHHERQNARF